MKALLWIWIVVMTAWLLFYPPFIEPLSEVFWKNVPAFEISVFGHHTLGTRVDFGRLAAQILAINFIPTILLWKWDALVRHSTAVIQSIWRFVQTPHSVAIVLIMVATYCLMFVKPSRRPHTSGLFDDLIPDKFGGIPISNSAPTPDPKFVLIPILPATANQVKKAQPANP